MVRVQFSPATKGTYVKEVVVPADQFGLPNANPPSIVDLDNVTLYSFTVDTDKATYKFYIPADYAGGDIDFEVDWTNDGGVDDNGKNVKWQLDYQTVAPGEVMSGSHANSPKSVEDTYDSESGWVEHHAGIMTIAAADFAGKHHILLKLSAVAPTGDALTGKPHLLGIFYDYRAIWGRKP